MTFATPNSVAISVMASQIMNGFIGVFVVAFGFD